MLNVVFELCVESVDACLAAREGGAHRIEVCTALSEGGLTPSHGLIRAAIEQSRLPTHILLRPRSGDFLYTPAELAVMREDLKYARSLGASGVVVGFLHADGKVDVERTREFVALAGPLEVTFHRAFDCAESQAQALEDVIATGCGRVLTSGGERDVVRGAKAIALLVKQAAGRIDIAVGGGLRLNNATGVARVTGARHFHGSLRRRIPSPMLYTRPGMLEDEGALTETRVTVESGDIRRIIDNLRNA